MDPRWVEKKSPNFARGGGRSAGGCWRKRKGGERILRSRSSNSILKGAVFFERGGRRKIRRERKKMAAKGEKDRRRPGTFETVLARKTCFERRTPRPLFSSPGGGKKRGEHVRPKSCEGTSTSPSATRGPSLKKGAIPAKGGGRKSNVFRPRGKRPKLREPPDHEGGNVIV